MKRLRAGPLLRHLLESIDNFTQANPEPHAPQSTATATTKSAPRLVQEARKPLSSSSGNGKKEKDHLKEWRGRKLHLYSAHDGTLLYALTALGLWRNGAAFGRLPPYASAFIVELHYRHAHYELDFFFRNRTAPLNASAVQIFLPGASLVLNFHFLYYWFYSRLTHIHCEWNLICCEWNLTSKQSILLLFNAGLGISILPKYRNRFQWFFEYRNSSQANFGIIPKYRNSSKANFGIYIYIYIYTEIGNALRNQRLASAPTHIHINLCTV